MYKYNNIGNAYCGRGLKDYFNAEGMTIGAPTGGWYSKISNRSFGAEGGQSFPNRRITAHLDSDNKPYLAMKKGNFADDYPYFKLVDLSIASPYVIPISNYFNTTGFTIQATLTYEQLSNYCGILGLHDANQPTGLVFGQYVNGNIYFGLYPINGQEFSASVAQGGFPAVKFNVAMMYRYGYHYVSGLTEGRVYLYINGLVETSIAVPNNWSWTNNLGISLGYAYNADNRYMKGNLYSLLLYDEALNDMEIHHNYMVDKRKYLIPN